MKVKNYFVNVEICCNIVKNVTEYMQKNKQNNANLKEILPYGAIKKIAFRSKKSIYTVSRVVNGGSNNNDVLKCITEYLRELNTDKRQLKETVEETKMYC